MKINLDQAMHIVEDALDTMEDMNGIEVDDSSWSGSAPSQDARRKRTELAHQTRVILVLADRLALAEALVRNQYWAAKGEPDRLLPPA